MCRRPGNRDRIRIASGAAGIERLEAHLHGQAFASHRHDTYAIGITLSGIQTFRFRGERWRCLPGQCHILHPDETHDGAAGTDQGFSYRIVYIDPRLVQQALPGRKLPFVARPVMDPPGVSERYHCPIWDLDEELDDLRRTELVVAAASLLVGAASPGTTGPGRLALERLSAVRDLLADDPTARCPMDRLERMSGLDRWTLARQFRAAFGTSPSRFRTMRQLDRVRRLLQRGASLVAAATEAGFSDQSHMSRQFKRAYGLTPGAWVSAIARCRPAGPTTDLRRDRT